MVKKCEESQCMYLICDTGICSTTLDPFLTVTVYKFKSVSAKMLQGSNIIKHFSEGAQVTRRASDSQVKAGSGCSLVVVVVVVD